ncbi:hypothetical protein MCUN1_003541 [Malassezia cuniculi]|uniref:Uncharacterized protein n=1 Tax=Malassezia cuniculi TaxID=948313 RepID=A0AAF0EWX3_9BASI|nr:hypothetical protein MCUN1_003541 [Malassezia cuniculi]
MLRPSAPLLSKASRMPLNSKKANKDFYKGTRTGNILRRKRIALADSRGNQHFDELGRPRTWNLRTHRIDESRIPSFVVPPGLADTKVSATADELRPYVYIGAPTDGGNQRPEPGVPDAPKMSSGGMDGEYYSRLVDRMLLSKSRS